MSFFLWWTRRVGGLSMVVLVALSYWAISREYRTTNVIETGKSRTTGDAAHMAPTSMFNPTVIWSYYSLLIHILVFAFPCRACWAVFDLTRSLKKVALNKQLKDYKLSSQQRRMSSTSLSSADTLTPTHSTSGSEAGDMDAGSCNDSDIDQDKVVHAILVPNYKEELDHLRETLDVLACHPQARYQYDVYLAMEARESGVELKAMGLISEYVKKFRFIDFTLHPSGIPGESPGKGSNIGWAARKASERYSTAQRKDVIITGIDADSHVSSNYFALITAMHMAYPETSATTMYCPPIIFDRNAHLVPTIVRVADVLWCAAGLSGLYTNSQVRPPTSVYSVPLELVDRVGGWDTDPEAIGEDLHMYLKCYFALNGNLITRTVLAPVSQCNVTAGVAGPRGVLADFQARYKQAMRHMWGALDSGFAIRSAWRMWRERKNTIRTFRPVHTNHNETENVYVPQPDMEKLMEEQPVENGVFSDVVHDTLSPINYWRTLILCHRLFEAHFLPIHMAILVVTTGLYGMLMTGRTDPYDLNWTYEISNYLRVGGFLLVAVYMGFYEYYHIACVTARENDMKAAGLYDNMTFSHRSFRQNFFDYFAIPIVAPAFGSIPASQAEICHFWTQELVYTVSKKPMRQRARSILKAKAVLAEIMPV